MSKAFTFAALRSEYTGLLSRMVIQRAAEARTAAGRLFANRERYKAVEAVTGVPWQFIAVLHNRESGGKFEGVLHNGEKIIGTGRKTRLVPAGRGPFTSWEAAAIDALKLKGFEKITDWSIERMCFCAESYNGWGYRYKGLPSAYLWAGSNNYKAGKYVADGVWSATAVDQQLGCMVVYDYLAAMMDQGDAIKPAPPPPNVPPTPVPAPAKRSPLQAILDALKSIFRRG